MGKGTSKRTGSCESSSGVSSDESNTPEGFLRLELSLDIINQLCGFFGDGSNADGIRSTVDLPFDICYEIYKAATTSIDFRDSTENDEMLALKLHTELNKDPREDRVYSAHDQEAFERLCSEFYVIPRKHIMSCFVDNNYDSVATRKTLGFFTDEPCNLKDYATTVRNGCNAFPPQTGTVNNDFGETIKADERLALELHSKLNANPNKELTQKDRKHLNQLSSEFSDLPHDIIKACYVDNEWDYAATRETLAVFAQEKRVLKDSRKERRENNSSNIDTSSSSSWTPVAPRRKVENKGKNKWSIEHAQELSRQDMARSKELFAKQGEFLERASNASGNKMTRLGASSYYTMEASKYRRIAYELVQEANQRLCEANLDTRGTSIDLHLLNVPNAISLLRIKLSQMDRDPAFRNGPSTKTLNVITGYGKSNNGQCKLKPNVITWLRQHKYSFSHANAGQIIVTCK
uniref:Smr domain-containing protein n=1 Tax=Steinernema glaseri TaxID=37863 RepID=A0A1I7Z434_9BILA